MIFENSLIAKGMEYIIDKIRDIHIPILKGLVIIFSWLVICWFILYFLLYQAIFDGTWIRTAIILGLWLFAEIANYIGHRF